MNKQCHCYRSVIMSLCNCYNCCKSRPYSEVMAKRFTPELNHTALGRRWSPCLQADSSQHRCHFKTKYLGICCMLWVGQSVGLSWLDDMLTTGGRKQTTPGPASVPGQPVPIDSKRSAASSRQIQTQDRIEREWYLTTHQAWKKQ